jgi:hypothetical protein
MLLIGIGRHQDDVDRAVAPRQKPRLPAQLDPGHGRELGAGDQRAYSGFRFDMGERLRPIDECAHLVAIDRKQLRYGFEHRATGIDHDDLHDANLLEHFQEKPAPREGGVESGFPSKMRQRKNAEAASASSEYETAPGP